MEALLKAVFCLLVAVFSLAVVAATPLLKKVNKQARFWVPLFVVILLLGGALIFLTVALGASGVFKVFLLLAGAGATATGIGTLLHAGIEVLSRKLSDKKAIDETVFFIIGLFVGPLAFLTGMIGIVIIYVSSGLVIG